jgi:hypothetical protein
MNIRNFSFEMDKWKRELVKKFRDISDLNLENQRNKWIDHFVAGSNN